MRIIGGNLKGKKIYIPLDKSTRPLKDRVRESIFNIIKHSQNEFINLKGTKILDLFAGTGSFGIECLSRGAEKVIFFENYKKTSEILKKNLNLLDLNHNSMVVEKDSYDFNQNQIFFKKFNLIFLDPPFKDNRINELIEKIKKMKITNEKSLVILHRNKEIKEKISKKFIISREKNYGLSKIIFGKII